jgi:hypothetical protein
MKPSIGDRAVDACLDYVRAKNEVESLRRQIGQALMLCPNSRIDSREPTHLSAFYRMGDLVRELGSYGYDGRDFAAELVECPHCAKAHQLVLQRKRARLSFGAAKRQIARIAKESA